MSALLPSRFAAAPAAAALLLACVAWPAVAGAQAHAHATPPDTSFAALQARGKRAMGVDQYTSTHRFDDLADGGRIVLQRAPSDTAGARVIREHLRTIAAAFRAGDFATPAFVHVREVPGTRVMAARRAAIAYAYRALPGGGEVRITTRDPEALGAVHAFLAFQRSDHRAAGRTRADSARASGATHAGHAGHAGHAPPR